MLVLSRKSDESVIIAGKIIVTILAIEGDRVKLGITAPPEVIILRQEVRDRRARRQSEPRPSETERAPCGDGGARPPAQRRLTSAPARRGRR